jgi:hypothetical protein
MTTNSSNAPDVVVRGIVLGANYLGGSVCDFGTITVDPSPGCVVYGKDNDVLAYTGPTRRPDATAAGSGVGTVHSKGEL